MPVIYSARGISKRFGVVQALCDVDLDVPAGSVVGLVGARLRGRGYVVAAAGWTGLMGMAYAKTRSRAEAIREFGSGSPKFLCLTGDRF